jgi:hypothetical protein
LANRSDLRSHRFREYVHLRTEDQD